MSLFGEAVGVVVGGAASATPTGAVSAIANVVSKIIDWIHPDPTVAADIKLKLLSQEGQQYLSELAINAGLMQGQMEINKTEASSSNWFVAGWRPAIGWVGATALGCYYIPRALVTTIVWLVACYHASDIVPFPAFDITDLLGLIGTMLGMSGFRTFDKLKGTAQ